MSAARRPAGPSGRSGLRYAFCFARTHHLQMAKFGRRDWLFATGQKTTALDRQPQADDAAGAGARTMTSEPDQDSAEVEIVFLQAVTCSGISCRSRRPISHPTSGSSPPAPWRQCRAWRSTSSSYRAQQSPRHQLEHARVSAHLPPRGAALVRPPPLQPH